VVCDDLPHYHFLFFFYVFMFMHEQAGGALSYGCGLDSQNSKTQSLVSCFIFKFFHSLIDSMDMDTPGKEQEFRNR